MTNDDGMDNPLPISKEGLIAALETAVEMVKEEDKEFTIEYLERLRDNIKEDLSSNYQQVIR